MQQRRHTVPSRRQAAPPHRSSWARRGAAALTATALAGASLVAGGVVAAAVGAEFEIDGNQTTDSTVDWQTLDGVDVVADAVGNADATTLTGQEQANTWAAGNPGTASGKSDIGNVLVADSVTEQDGEHHQWLFVAWDRDSGQGTGRYYLELNQAESAGLVPERTEGDLRIVVADRGNQGLACSSVDTWNGSDWADPVSCDGVVDVAVNDAPVSDHFGSPNADAGTLGADRFVEAALDLTALGVGQTCPAVGFASLHVRSQEGGQNHEQGQLKDYAAGAIDVPSLCSQLEIVKVGEDGEPVPGVTFLISPNPATGQNDTTVVTGEDGTFTITDIAHHGEYTVTELLVPAESGYLMPPPAERTRTVTLGPAETESLTFTNPRPWEPLTVAVTGTAERFTTRTWEVEKDAGSPHITLPADEDTATVEFVVEVIEGPSAVDESQDARDITVTVSNPNDAPVVGTLDVDLDGTACEVDATDVDAATDGLQVELAPGDQELTVTCDDDELAGTVTATVAWDLGAYPQTQAHVDDPSSAGTDSATADVTIDPEIRDGGPASVDVWDDFVTPDDEPVHLGTVEAVEEANVTSFPVTREVAVEQGECIDVVNEAYVLAGQEELDRDSASVTVCRQAPGTLGIAKVGEDGEPVPGVEFLVTPDPATGEGEVTVATDAEGTYTFDETAHLGEYTVTEISVPAGSGYLMPAPADRTHVVTLDEGETETVEFTNPLAWEPLGVEVGGQAEWFMTRTWATDKSAPTEKVTLGADEETAEVRFLIEVVEGPSTIAEDTLDVAVAVTNPNASDVVGTLEVELDGTMCEVVADDADAEAPGLQVAFAPGEHLYVVSCDDPDEAGGAVGATVTWDHAAYPAVQEHVDDPAAAGVGTATDELAIDPEVFDAGPFSVDVYDELVQPAEEPVLLGTVDAEGVGTTTVFEVVREVAVERGECVEVVNEAFLVADDAELGRDSATVTVCRDVPPPTAVPPTPDLPRTGAAPGLAILATLLLIAAGTGLLMARRGRSA